MNQREKRGYSYAEAATYLGLSESSIIRAVRQGDIPAKYARGRVLIDGDDLDAYFDGLPTEREPAK